MANVPQPPASTMQDRFPSSHEQPSGVKNVDTPPQEDEHDFATRQPSSTAARMLFAACPCGAPPSPSALTATNFHEHEAGNNPAKDDRPCQVIYGFRSG
eukprot:5110960-Amphidinium_carterae.9